MALWLSKPGPNEKLDIPKAAPIQMREEGVKIFYNPACQWCIYMNEGVKKLVRELKPDTQTEEISLWDPSKEALRRGVTCLATYVNGKPLLPMSPEQFRQTVRKTLQKAR